MDAEEAVLRRYWACLAAHDAKAQRVEAKDDTLLAAYLIDPGRAEYALDDLAQEYGFDVTPVPVVDEETTALVRRAEIPRRLVAPMRARLLERGALELYENVELPLTRVLAAMEDAGVKIDTYRMGEITARLADRVEELESKAYELAGEEFMLGSTQQVGRIMFEKLGLTAGRKGKTGYSTDARVLRGLRGTHAIVPLLEANTIVFTPAFFAASHNRRVPSTCSLYISRASSFSRETFPAR